MKIWRYITSDQLQDLLNGSLYFARADQFEDILKDAETEMSFNALLDEMYDPMFEPLEFRLKLQSAWENILSDKKKKALLSCWHMGDKTDEKLWTRYAAEGKTIAIATTVSQMKDINMGLDYNYVDFPIGYQGQEDISDSSIPHTELMPFMFKSHKESEDREYRFMIFKAKAEETFEEFQARLKKMNFYDPESVIANMYASKLEDFEDLGYKVAIDPWSIINEIAFSPSLSEVEINAIKESFKIQWRITMI